MNPGFPRSKVDGFVLQSQHVNLRIIVHASEAGLEMCSGSQEGSYLRLIDFFITQL